MVSAFGHVANFGRLRLAGHLALCLGIRRPAASIHQSNCRIVEVRLHLHSPACKIRLHDQKGRAAGRAACRNHAPGIVEPLLPCIFSCLRGPIANPGASPQAVWCGIGSSMLSVNNRFEILLPFFLRQKALVDSRALGEGKDALRNSLPDRDDLSSPVSSRQGQARAAISKYTDFSPIWREKRARASRMASHGEARPAKCGWQA